MEGECAAKKTSREGRQAVARATVPCLLDSAVTGSTDIPRALCEVGTLADYSNCTKKSLRASNRLFMIRVCLPSCGLCAHV